MSQKIGEFMASIGAMTKEQVSEVLEAQNSGDTRRFGDIAVQRGYIQDNSLKRYADYFEESNE